jgi:ketosteroid isomerase-like protein
MALPKAPLTSGRLSCQFTRPSFAMMIAPTVFIFKKGDDGKWRIARYSFSTTNRA